MTFVYFNTNFNCSSYSKNRIILNFHYNLIYYIINFNYGLKLIQNFTVFL